jgi:hypothetical protein
MGSLLFTCVCGGFRFLGSADDRPYAAHFLPEQQWYPFWDAVDAAVESSGPSAREKADACMALRAWPARSLWQCPRCGALYVEDPQGGTHRFLPESDAVPRELFLPEAPPEPAGKPAAEAPEPGAPGLGQVEACVRLGEEAYDRMYDASSSSAATACYSDAKEAFRDAIRLAREQGIEERALALEARLEHIKAVFRSQFT